MSPFTWHLLVGDLDDEAAAPPESPAGSPRAAPIPVRPDAVEGASAAA